MKKSPSKKPVKKTPKKPAKKTPKPVPSFPQMERKAAALNRRVQRGERLYYEICRGEYAFVAFSGDERHFAVNRKGEIVAVKDKYPNVIRYSPVEMIYKISFTTVGRKRLRRESALDGNRLVIPHTSLLSCSS